MIGRIDVHSHLLPAIDDGCTSIEESVACAQMLQDAGYTHAFCTPHVWPNLPHVTAKNLRRWTAILQEELEQSRVNLRLLIGGEISLQGMLGQSDGELVTYSLAGRYCLVDLWADRLPPFFEPQVRRLQARGLTVILAHPERMRAVQEEASAVIGQMSSMGILLQGNLQCLADPPEAPTRMVAEQLLTEGRYFLLGTDLHGPRGLAARLAGLQRAIELVGSDAVDRLTIHHPRMLAPELAVAGE